MGGSKGPFFHFPRMKFHVEPEAALQTKTLLTFQLILQWVKTNPWVLVTDKELRLLPQEEQQFQY